MIGVNEIEANLSKVAKRMMSLNNTGIKEQFPISLIDINCWEWPQGVGLLGLYKYYTVSGNTQIWEFLVDWFDDRIREGIPPQNVNTTAPMLTLTYIYEHTRADKYRQLIREWADWIMKDKKLIRTGDECFQHMVTGDDNDGEILIDTIFMTLLFLGRAGTILNKQEYIDEVNYQLLNHIKYLFDKEAGLFYHGFNFNYNHNYGKVHWGRGNSWYTVGIIEYLSETKVDAALERYFLSVYKAQAKALREYADQQTGLWRTVIDDQTADIEISASAGFLCGIMAGVRLGILKESGYGELIEKALAHITEYISADGTVEQVSYGTPIGPDADFYKKIPCCPMTYGQALMILNLQEAMKDFWH